MFHQPEVRQVTKTDGIKPEYVVQCVMQTERDQQTVEECVDTSTYSSHLCDTFAQCNQNAKQYRPYEQQNYGYNDRNNTCYDSYATFAAEE